MEKIARIPVGHLSVKAETHQLLAGHLVVFDGKSDQNDILAIHAPAGSPRVLGNVQYHSADPKAKPAPAPHDNTLRTDIVRSTSIAFCVAGEEIDEGDELAVGANGTVVKADAAVAASASTGVVGDNNALTFTAEDGGDEGNDLSIALIDPAGKEKALSVDVDGDKIIVNLATDAESKISSTAADIIAALAEDNDASQVISAANTGASNGTGKVKAVAETALKGGTDAASAVARAFTKGDAEDFIEAELY